MMKIKNTLLSYWLVCTLFIQIVCVPYDAVSGFAFFPQNPFLHPHAKQTSSTTGQLLSKHCSSNARKNRIPSSLNPIGNRPYFITTSTSLQGKRKKNTSWLPSMVVYEDYCDSVDLEGGGLEARSIDYLANLINARLMKIRSSSTDDDGSKSEKVEEEPKISISKGARLAKGRFRDLTCTQRGEKILEDMFNIGDNQELEEPDEKDTIRGAIVALQSLLILGTQVGVKGTPHQQKKMLSHLYDENDWHVMNLQDFDSFWDQQSTRQLKHRVDVTAGLQLLAKLLRKRTSIGAFNLLVELGVFNKHEDLALLRSGFSINFLEEEVTEAIKAERSTHDPDALLGVRQDLRKLKVYTIDKESVTEVDDGISIETVDKPDGSKKNRIWIHIADVDRWSPRDSAIFQVAQRRLTSLYLPTGPVPMFPTNFGNRMSLGTSDVSYALSLAVELNEDGSVDSDSLQITPSLINVRYKLSYDEVDEMFDDGIVYFEEWELGALLSEAKKRRKFRMANGCMEDFIPRNIPKNDVQVVPDEHDEDQLRINIGIGTSSSGGFNQTSTINPLKSEGYATALSSAFFMVTEIMILAGEAMGKYGSLNDLPLPYRTQAKPDFAARYEESNELESLKDVGDGYCHAWYARRFMKPVKITENSKGHAGLGLECYVQWTSPIRRFGDLQVHGAVKRYLRKNRLNELMQLGDTIPSSLTSSDLGCAVPKCVKDSKDELGKYREYKDAHDIQEGIDVCKIDFKQGIGFIQAARMVQNNSQLYWILEYIRRKEKANPAPIFEAVVLGCVDYQRYQYAIYVYELGLEHRYLSEAGRLQTGAKLHLKVASNSPNYGLLTFTMAKM